MQECYNFSHVHNMMHHDACPWQRPLHTYTYALLVLSSCAVSWYDIYTPTYIQAWIHFLPTSSYHIMCTYIHTYIHTWTLIHTQCHNNYMQTIIHVQTYSKKYKYAYAHVQLCTKGSRQSDSTAIVRLPRKPVPVYILWPHVTMKYLAIASYTAIIALSSARWNIIMIKTRDTLISRKKPWYGTQARDLVTLNPWGKSFVAINLYSASHLLKSVIIRAYS